MFPKVGVGGAITQKNRCHHGLGLLPAPPGEGVTGGEGPLPQACHPFSGEWMTDLFETCKVAKNSLLNYPFTGSSRMLHSTKKREEWRTVTVGSGTQTWHRREGQDFPGRQQAESR